MTITHHLSPPVYFPHPHLLMIFHTQILLLHTLHHLHPPPRHLGKPNLLDHLLCEHQLLRLICHPLKMEEQLQILSSMVFQLLILASLSKLPTNWLDLSACWDMGNNRLTQPEQLMQMVHTY